MVVMAAAVVTMGFMLGVAPSSSLPATAIPSTLSLFYGVFSSLFIAFHAVLIKSSLPYCNNSTIELAWWTNAGSAILILPFVILNGEPSKLYELAHTETWNWTVFLWGTLVTGFFGFLLCVAGLLSIKVTSPITHMFSSVSPVFPLPNIENANHFTGRSICPPNCIGRLDFPGHPYNVSLHYPSAFGIFANLNSFCN
jgi:GDP-fucose transporter C1